MEISFITQSHLEMDMRLSDVRQELEQRCCQDEAQARQHLVGLLEVLRAAISEHVEREEREFFPRARRILGELEELKQIQGQHAAMHRKLEILSTLSDQGAPLPELKSAVDDLTRAMVAHSRTKADFLDTNAGLLAPASTSDG